MAFSNPAYSATVVSTGDIIPTATPDPQPPNLVSEGGRIVWEALSVDFTEHPSCTGWRGPS